MKPFYLFHTDFYQMSMSMAYIFQPTYDDSLMANVETGFELFVRNIKTDVNPNGDGYIMGGAHKIKRYIDQIKKELLDRELKDTFKRLVLPKFDSDPTRQADYGKMLDAYWPNLRTDFTFRVVPNGTIVHPYLPVFQYKGPRWIGQLIETAVSVIVNARTGLATREGFGLMDVDLDLIRPLVDPNSAQHPNEITVISDYIADLGGRADEFRAATSGQIMEAGFRRAPSFSLAVKGAQIAIEHGWDGTSNVAAHFYSDVPIDKIVGTMAHAFVMSFENELDAFKSWNSLFPNSTVISDTNDTIEAARMLVQNNIQVKKVRIDSGDLAFQATKTDEVFKGAGWDTTNVLSGDISPEMLIRFHKEGVPFSGTMAGTEYYHHGMSRFVNAGFVYKTVQFEGKNGLVYPRKKSMGKGNPAGLKKMIVKDGVLIIDCKPRGNNYGITNVDALKINRDTPVEIINE